MNIKPSNIRFTHDSIKNRFSCNRSLQYTYGELYNERITPDDIPTLTVKRLNGLWFVKRGNRRLWVYRELEKHGKIHTIYVDVTDDPIPARLITTTDEGKSIEIRGPYHLEKSPGPTVWAHLSSKPNQQSFLDTWSKDATCIALTADGNGYFSRWKDGSWRYRGMPVDVTECISEKSAWTEPEFVALGSEDRFFVSFEDGSSEWMANSRSFDIAAKVVGKKKKGPKSIPSMVAFGPDDGWWILREDGSSEWDGLPASLTKALREAQSSASFVSVSSSGGWFAVIGGKWKYRELDNDSIIETVDDEDANYRDIHRIHFGGDYENESWVIEFK